MSKTKRIAEAYTNEYGTFNPGDQCFAITMSTGILSVSRAEYVGYVERTHWSKTVNKYVQVRRNIPMRVMYYKGTEDRAVWPWGKDREVESRMTDRMKIVTLQLNNILPVSTTIDTLIERI